jgi:hypothetical protein
MPLCSVDPAGVPARPPPTGVSARPPPAGVRRPHILLIRNCAYTYPHTALPLTVVNVLYSMGTLIVVAYRTLGYCSAIVL